MEQPVTTDPDPAEPEPSGSPDIAVLDAPVLLMGGLTLFLLELAAAGAFEPAWSDLIHTDWGREQQRLSPNLPVERIRHRRQMLDQAFPAANVATSRDLLEEVNALCATPAEKKGAHVLAAALTVRAHAVVTDPILGLEALAGRLWHPVVIRSPDAWCVDLMERRADAVRDGAAAHRARLGANLEPWLRAVGVTLPRTAARLADMRDRL